MNSEKNSNERKSERQTPVREAIISIVLTGVASIAIGVFTNLLTYSLLFMDGFYIDFLEEYGTITVIILSVIGVAYVLTRVAVTYSQRKILQTETAIKKLHEKESLFFQSLETDLSSLLAKKVQ